MNTALSPATQVATAAPKPTALTEHAVAIKALSRRMAADVIEIGERLIVVQRILGHGGFMNWIASEFGWSSSTATRFMQTARLVAKFTNLTNLPVPLAGLYALAAPKVPEHVVEEVIERASSGEVLTLKEITALIPRKSGAPKTGKATGTAMPEPTGSLAHQALDLIMRMSPAERRDFAVRARGLLPVSALMPEAPRAEAPKAAAQNLEMGFGKSAKAAPIVIDAKPVSTSTKHYEPDELKAEVAARLADVDEPTGIPNFLRRQS